MFSVCLFFKENQNFQSIEKMKEEENGNNQNKWDKLNDRILILVILEEEKIYTE